MSSSLHWQETSPGTHQRDIDSTERFYVSASHTRSPVVNKGDWYVNAGVKLECSRPNFVADIQKAWIRTRFDFPGLAATIVEDKWSYKTADKAELEGWLKETFHVHLQPSTARQLISEDKLVPASRVTLHVLPNTQELMIQGPHTHLDGFGIMKTLQHIISYVVQLPLLSDVDQIPVAFGHEAHNLSPPMSLTCQTPPCSAEDRQKWDKLMEDFIDPKHKIYLNTRNETSPPRFSRTQWLVFDATSTKSLQSEAQKHGVSLAAVLQGAISLSTRVHGGGEDLATRHAIQVLYSARKYIDPTIGSGENIVSPLVVGVPLTYTLHDDFHDLVTDANEVLLEGRKDKFGLKCGHLWGSDLPRAFAAPLPKGKRIRAEAQMSYMGNIQSYIQEWTEDKAIGGSLAHCVDFWLSLDILSANVVIEIYIFRGRLNLSLAYNETFHSEESMTEYLQLVKGHLDDGLGIQTDASVRRPGREEWM
ncbi:hypothetical protein PEX1_049040 [Penicillium expansum]|uniref:Condensation domain-containing protein n=1 Tax=Penicillium expansum TaxID=27334 RepID=A0A0A2JIY2_PENEN|nr:hypothetical protein PEX2_090240 [Penicillium expansum]KGO47530.1 hypothetical protein PEXP_014170 [Penicillium expansum]KGO54771.1 hypothetical protein PEX2_090240 [Penicillium expansum]KGO61282.1 hypothetical protein PEX1_049040 [Penicillium expansum]